MNLKNFEPYAFYLMTKKLVMLQYICTYFYNSVAAYVRMYVVIIFLCNTIFIVSYEVPLSFVPIKKHVTSLAYFASFA